MSNVLGLVHKPLYPQVESRGENKEEVNKPGDLDSGVIFVDIARFA